MSIHILHNKAENRENKKVIIRMYIYAGRSLFLDGDPLKQHQPSCSGNLIAGFATSSFYSHFRRHDTRSGIFWEVIARL